MIAARRSRFAGASADIARAYREERERTYPDRVYRQVSEAIDRACDQVELVNLAGGGECPAAVAVVLAQLQRLAGEPAFCQPTSWEAHEELFRLSSVLLGRPEAETEAEAEAER